MFKQRIIHGAALLLTALAVTAGCSASVVPAIPSNNKSGSTQTLAYQTGGTNTRGITVVGVGKAFGAPDTARVNVGIETRDQSVQKAVADNNARMTQLLDTLKRLGIEENDIQTVNYSVYTERQPGLSPEGKGEERPLIYHVNNQVTLTVRDLAKLGDILDKAVAAGANNVYGISFSVADPSKLEAEARAKAVADAKARAESLAALTGVGLGDILSISEVISGPGMVTVLESARGISTADVPTQPGELEVQMSVQVTYNIK